MQMSVPPIQISLHCLHNISYAQQISEFHYRYLGIIIADMGIRIHVIAYVKELQISAIIY